MAQVYIGLMEIFIKIWRTAANICINLISPETRVYAEHFCGGQHRSTFISFYAIVFEICAKNPRCTCAKMEFNIKRLLSHSRSHILGKKATRGEIILYNNTGLIF